MIRLWTKQERNELWATCGVSPFDTPSHIYNRELGECRASCSCGFTWNRHGGPMGRCPIEAVRRWHLGPVSIAQFGTNRPRYGWEVALWALVPNTSESGSVLCKLTYRWALWSTCFYLGSIGACSLHFSSIFHYCIFSKGILDFGIILDKCACKK